MVNCGINQKRSSPGHQKSKRKAEAAVKTYKTMLKRTSQLHEDQWLALLEHRYTPRQDLKTNPAEIVLYLAVLRVQYFSCVQKSVKSLVLVAALNAEMQQNALKTIVDLLKRFCLFMFIKM